MSGAAPVLERFGLSFRNALTQPALRQVAADNEFIRKSSSNGQNDPSHLASATFTAAEPPAPQTKTSRWKVPLSRRSTPLKMQNHALRPQHRVITTAVLDHREMDTGFWGKLEPDIRSFAQLTEPEEIADCVEKFALIHRKHVAMFQRLKNTIIGDLDRWHARDLARVCKAWAQLGFLREDFCVAITGRVVATAPECEPPALSRLLDAYASTRCFVSSAVNVLGEEIKAKVSEFGPSDLCLAASAFARLNHCKPDVLELLVSRFLQYDPTYEPGKPYDLESEAQPLFAAHDLTLAAYAFGKLGCRDPHVYGFIAHHAQPVIRDFTAKDLQMLVTACERAEYRDEVFLTEISIQSQRRIAQFNAESLSLLLRGYASCGLNDVSLITRAICQVPRKVSSFRPTDIATLVNAMGVLQVHSPATFDVLAPVVLEKAAHFTPGHWVALLRGCALLGARDETILGCIASSLDPQKLTLAQLAGVAVDCSSLAFRDQGLLDSIVAVARARINGLEVVTPEIAAQLYSALRILDEDSSSPAAAELVAQLYPYIQVTAGSGRLYDQKRMMQTPSQMLQARGLSTALAPALTPGTSALLCYAELVRTAAAPTTDGWPGPWAKYLAARCRAAPATTFPDVALTRL